MTRESPATPTPADDRTLLDDPAVSVVLPTYERASVLPGAIRSVFEQTHGPVELVVVDGGSTDGTEEVLEAVGDGRLRVLRRGEPAGPGAARNAGIRVADGDYVAFVDADDRWRPTKLERQLAAMERADAAVALTGLEKSAGEPRTRDGAEGDVHEAVRRLDVPTYTSTLVASRAALLDAGGFDEDLACFEDWELCLRLSRDRRRVPTDATGSNRRVPGRFRCRRRDADDHPGRVPGDHGASTLESAVTTAQPPPLSSPDDRDRERADLLAAGVIPAAS